MRKYLTNDRIVTDVKEAIGYMHEQLTKGEIASIVKLVNRYWDKGYEAGYFAYRDELKALLGTKEREDSFFVKSEIKRNMKGL